MNNQLSNLIQPRIASLLALLLISFGAFAQDGKLLDIDIDLDKEEWYEQPWVWALVAVVLVGGILIGRKK